MMRRRFDAIKKTLNSMGEESLQHQFEFLVREIGSGVEKEEFSLLMDLFVELAERQWETYEILPEELRRDIGDTIAKIWDRSSIDSTEKLIGVIARLGLVETMNFLLKIAPQELGFEIAQVVTSAAIELGENVGDPYSGMG